MNSVKKSHFSQNSSDFSPIPELNIPNGVTTLFFIKSHSITYLEPCDDPVFAAHTSFPSNKAQIITYYSDHLVGVLGCFEQVGSPYCPPHFIASFETLLAHEALNSINSAIRQKTRFVLCRETLTTPSQEPCSI
jgi:hypothetical protein